MGGKRKRETHRYQFLAIIRTNRIEVWLKEICFVINLFEINDRNYYRRIFGKTRLNMDIDDWNESVETIPDFEEQYQRILKQLRRS